MAFLAFAGLQASAPGRIAQRATRLAFFIAGLAVSAWAPLVPFAKARATLDDGALGLLLLGLGIGSMATMRLAGALAARFGCRAVMVAASIVICLALPLLAILSTWAQLVMALLAFGAGLGALDCAMNIQAIIVERAAGRPMMSGFHGLFSLGGVCGSAGVGALLGLGAAPPVAALAVVAVLAVALAVAAPHWLARGDNGTAPLFAAPRGIVLFVGALCFVVFLTEGAALDWSAVALTSLKHVDPAYGGFGYAAFATAMTAGRLTGDRIVQRLGPVRIVGFGGLCAAAGLAVATLVPGWPAALLGFALVGAGCANIVPVFFSAIGRQTTMRETVAVPAITTMGYAGVLAGPAAIGAIAQASSLEVAFLVVAGLLVGVAASGRLLPT